jgi:hypothetical protein
MKTYQAEVITQVLYIRANSEDEAEMKYDAYFNEETCPCGVDGCDCVDDTEDTYHNMTLWEEGEEQ